MDRTLPTRAQVVIVGGGVIGCSTAYHLAKRGWTDVVVLERKQLTSGTTWHAAGLVTQARPTFGTREIVQRSLEVFRTLEADTGLSTGYERTGTLHLATRADRWEELRRQASVSRGHGIRTQLLGPDSTAELFPLLNPDGVVGSLYYPDEGRGNATDTTMSLARGARQRGVQIFENTKVTGVIRRDGRAVGVSTESGDIEAEYVVNCTGMWGREFGALAEVEVPLQALAHYYVVTEEIPGIPHRMPTLKSSDDYSYVKDESGALMVGFFEPGSKAWSSRGIPEDAEFTRIPEDWDHLGPFYEQMIERVPVLADAGIRLCFNGPESFTPDGFYHFGDVPGLRNYYLAAGFNSVGFLSGPGAGSVLADWIIDGRSPIDLPETDPRRIQRHETNRRFLEQRVVETLDLAYTVHWPFEQRQSARALRRSPLHERTAAAGAVFGELIGWERANWYAPEGVEKTYAYSFGRQNWFEHSAAEHRAVREGVGMFDLSSFGKLLVQGRDAERLLQRVSANNVAVANGRTVYTQWLNESGGIEADVTVTRLDDDRFLVLSGPATVRRDEDWLRRHIGPDDFATVADVTGTMALLSVMGPDSRRLLQPLTDADLSNEAFPFGTSREIDLGLGFVRATRITYVGELGWELLIPAELAVHIYDTLTEAGRELGLRHAGYHALNSLRIEKAYRSWGHDISGGDTPLEAGLGFAVAWDKPGGFVGREALLQQREQGVTRRLVQFVLQDPDAFAYHDEPIHRDGELVGRVVSAMYGHTLGGCVALGWVTLPAGTERAAYERGAYEIEIATERVPARASLRPLYDPKSERPKS
ncbi:FAD-dependent oxidoreductase [Streptacidiphilus sp. EB103A]|uniref:GcvT family protein n=1 Tax=Streptacidiphilus sp. EB103A TaxID=3156275 RepID=UPI0035111B0B